MRKVYFQSKNSMSKGIAASLFFETLSWERANLLGYRPQYCLRALGWYRSNFIYLLGPVLSLQITGKIVITD